MSNQPQYRPGDVANGHVLTAAGVWVPLAQPSQNQIVTGVPATGALPPAPVGSSPSSLSHKKPALSRGAKVGLGVGGGLAAVAAIGLGAALALGGSSVEAPTAASTRSSTSPPTGAPSTPAAAPTTVEPTPEPAPADLSTYQLIDQGTWEALVRDPRSASGQQVVLFAEITQFDHRTGTDTFLANAGVSQPSGAYELATNTVFSGDDALFEQLLDGDIVKVWATVDGVFEYENLVGASASAPLLDVQSIEVAGLYDLAQDVTLGALEARPYSGQQVPITVLNTASAHVTYSVTVAASSPDGTLQYDTASAYISDLAPGQQGSDAAMFLDELPPDAVITVVDVSRY